MRVVLADANAVSRSALRFWLEHEHGVEVVAEAASREDVFFQVDRTSPDLVFVDWENTGSAPCEVVAELRTRWPALRIIVVARRPESRESALAASADGFIRKDAPLDQLRLVLHHRR